MALRARAAAFEIGPLPACLVRCLPALLVAPPLLGGRPLLAVVLIVPSLRVRCAAPPRILFLLSGIVGSSSVSLRVHVHPASRSAYRPGCPRRTTFLYACWRRSGSSGDTARTYPACLACSSMSSHCSRRTRWPAGTRCGEAPTSADRADGHTTGAPVPAPRLCCRAASRRCSRSGWQTGPGGVTSSLR